MSKKDAPLAEMTAPAVAPTPNGGGLALTTISVPRAVAEAGGVDRIDVQPVSGDGAYSLGHLVLLGPAP